MYCCCFLHTGLFKCVTSMTNVCLFTIKCLIKKEKNSHRGHVLRSHVQKRLPCGRITALKKKARRRLLASLWNSSC